MRLTFCLFFIPAFSFAQLTGEWVGYDQYRSKQKMLITDDYMIMYHYGYTDVPENSKWQAKDSIPIHSVKDGVIVIRNKRSGDGFAAGIYTFREDGKVLKLAQLYKKFTTPEEATEAGKGYKYSDIIAREYFKPDYFGKVENMKSLDELSKVDFLTVMNRLQSYDKDMEGFLEDSNPYMRRMVFRFTEGIINRSFIELGYNPYKMTETWFFNNFRDDPDVQAIMSKQVHLRLE